MYGSNRCRLINTSLAPLKLSINIYSFLYKGKVNLFSQRTILLQSLFGHNNKICLPTLSSEVESSSRKAILKFVHTSFP